MNRRTFRIAGLLLIGIVWQTVPRTADAAPNDWAEGTPGKHDGATRDYYNRAAMLSWTNHMGDWRDADNRPQGETPFAQASGSRSAVDQAIEWDVTSLVQKWNRGELPNQGFFLRRVDGDGDLHFASRENADEAFRPRLILKVDGKETALSPVADTHLEPSTYRSMGDQPTLRVGRRNNALLRFDLSQLESDKPLEAATLRLHCVVAYGSDPVQIGVYRSSQGHGIADSQAKLGLAAKHPMDRGIEENPAVVFAADFESDSWDKGWSRVAQREAIAVAADDETLGFEPLSGKALRVRIAEGANGALNTIFKFSRETGAEPEEIYFRYYLRLASDWNQTLQGGKMPGISGTYGIAGWGGRKSDGTDGWSARGAFHQTIPSGNPLEGKHPIGTYCYHADMRGQYGDIWLWQNDYLGYLDNDRWYSIEQYVKLNAPGENDGVLRAWIDGRLAFEKTDIRYRKIDKLKIEQIWMNVYHGGKLPSPRNQHLFIDNVVIAAEYIGPMVDGD